MKTDKIVFVQGNEACVLGALKAGCRFFAGYPITPASEIAELMSRKLPEHQGVFVQMEDEIASISAVIGATWGGFKSCTATSGPGFSLMQEGIGYAAETETPCVIINVMRGGPSTGQPTLSSQQDVMQAKYGSHGDYEVVVLCPSSVQESFELTVKAFNLADQFRIPVIILSDEIVGHTREKIRIPDDIHVRERKGPTASPERYRPYAPLESGLLDGMPSFGQGYRLLVDGQLHDETGNRAGHDSIVSGRLMERLCRKVTDHADELLSVDTEFLDDAQSVVVAYGSVARSALSAVRLARAEGVEAGFIKLRTLWPFPDRFLKKAFKNTSQIIIPEMNIGKISRELERLVNNRQEIVSIPKLGGSLHTSLEILEKIKSVS